MDADVALARFSGDRLGIVTRTECAALGMTLDQVERRVTAGLLVPAHPGVYRHAASPPTFEGRLLAATLACGAGVAAASGPSAMRLYGIRGEWDDRLELTLLGTEHLALPGVHVRRIDALRAGDVHRRFGIPVLAPPLALLLLGASVSPGKVAAAVHDMVFQRFTTRARLLDALAAYGGRGRRGTVAYRAAVASLDDAGAATQTTLELDLLRLLRLHGLPEPRLQLRVGPFRLDLAYPGRLLDIEADGDRWHLSAADRRRDRDRDRALRALGWDVLRFGSADIHLHPSRTVAAVRASLAARPHGVRASCQRTVVA